MGLLALVAFVHRLSEQISHRHVAFEGRFLTGGFAGKCFLKLLSLLSLLGSLGAGSSAAGLTALVIQKFSGFAT